MNAVTNLSRPISTTKQVRPFDVRRDMGPVADLVELCFADTLDPEGKRFIQRMRSAAKNKGFLSWAAVNAEWLNMPLSGYVWEQDNILVGNISLIPYNIEGQRSYLIANVAVHPDYRRLGIARELTVQAMEHARKRGAPGIRLHVREENDQALELYKSMGFVEHARRTTWVSTTETPQDELGIKSIFSTPQGYQWLILRDWIRHNYPPEVTWHLPLNSKVLRSGLWGSICRLFNKTRNRQWVAQHDDKALAGLIWQTSNSYADLLWLAAPSDVDDKIIQTLLNHTRKQLGTQRPLKLDYPARHFAQGIRKGGFTPQQTLIWMSVVF
jgi:ribosomal protein S18 acetylase RimI-like enzyme